MTSTRPIDLQSTLRAVAEGAANVCEADDTVSFELNETACCSPATRRAHLG